MGMFCLASIVSGEITRRTGRSINALSIFASNVGLMCGVVMANDLWRTPPEVIEYIERKFGEIKIDLCSSDENKVCEFNLTEDDNFLDDSWLSNSMVDIGDLCWCNPPYSKPLPFVKQCVKWSNAGYAVAMILNMDTSTKWFDVIEKNASIVMPVTGARIAFLNGKGQPVKGNSKSQMLVYFAPFGRVGAMQTDYVSVNDIYGGE